MEKSDIYIGIPYSRIIKAIQDLDSSFNRMLAAQHDLEIIIERKKSVLEDIYRVLEKLMEAYAREVATVAGEKIMVEKPSRETLMEEINRINDILGPLM